MRAAQALDHVTRSVRDAFEPDVAEAIIGDSEMFEAAARRLGRDTDPTEVTAIAGDVDDGLADWLTETADSPAGWFYRQINER